MKILVLGGSYFLGKCFVKKAVIEHDVTVFNRGSRPLNIINVSEITGDRHDTDALSKIPRQHFDAVVDFCAYEKGDIELIYNNLSAGFDQYIFVSTCDVYEHGLGVELDESAPYERREFLGEAGAYITGKVSLEEELKACSYKAESHYTSIRPAFIYGPDNYAPREGIYFHWIKNAGQIIHPIDATGQFQMVYVEDAADAILNAIGNEKAYDRAFNLTPKPMITYEGFAEALKEAVDTEFTLVNVTVGEIIDKQIPLPFPLTEEESNYYNGDAALELIERYTPLADGLKKTYEAF